MDGYVCFEFYIFMYDLILFLCARPETSEAVENVDMSFEELQLLLRNHQHSIESSSASVDVGTNI